jgi:hypothetical protein
MEKQLTIPFGISPGCEPYYCEFLHKQEEICRGGLVFQIGHKRDCRECARTCAGCIEMAINFGFNDYEEVKHLIQRPQLLSQKYYNKWLTDNTHVQSKNLSAFAPLRETIL